MRLITQNVPSVEIRTARLGATLADIPAVSVAFERLPAFSFMPGDLPVGSVEFVTETMRLLGIRPPSGLSYPESLLPYLRRPVIRQRVGDLRPVAPVFVKPVLVKQFTGFVLRPGQAFEHYDEHDQEQVGAMLGLASDLEVYTSNVVEFLSEWRFYVQGRKVLGFARYDAEGADDAPEPDLAVVEEAVRRFEGPVAYAIDFGVLADGNTALVEVNDAWALGLYGRCLGPRAYLDLLTTRWGELAQTSRGPIK
jgi:hypothetical protein